MFDVYISIIFEATLYGGAAAVLCLGSREFGLYNLAAGGWLIAGGWLMAWVGSIALDWNEAPVEPHWFAVGLLLMMLQAIAPTVLGKRLQTAPLIYLLVSLGVALVISAAGPSLLLETAGATISVPSSPFGQVAYLAGLSVAVLLPILIFRSERWGRTVLDFRIAKGSLDLGLRLGGLILLEVLLLVCLGAAGCFVHKGVFASAEYRTIIPILALVAARNRPIRAAIWGFCVVGLANLLVLLPAYAEFSSVIAIALLLLVALKEHWPRTLLTRPAHVPEIPLLVRGRGIMRVGVTRDILVAVVVTVAASILLLWIMASRPTFVASSDVLNFLRVLVFALIAWIGYSRLGVLSLAWPLLGTVPVFLITACHQRWSLSCLAIMAFLAVSVSYLLLLRSIPAEPALLVDLGIVICVHQSFKTLPALTGHEEVVMFGHSLVIDFPPSLLSVALVGLICMVFSLGLGFSVHRLVRTVGLSTADFRFGLLHGNPAPVAFGAFCLASVVVAVLASVTYHLGVPAVSVDEISVEMGMIVLLLAYILSRGGMLIGVTLCGVVYGLLGGFLAGQGPLLPMSIGLLFILAAYSMKGWVTNA